MDSITQMVLGGAVGEATLGKKVGNKAVLYGMIAGTIPDLDVVANFLTDTITAIELHRGVSHSVFFALIMSPVFGWLVNKLERKKNLGWKPWARLFFWGLLTHAVLDAFTTWGTQLFWPFDLRLAYNTIFVIDPMYTVPFLIFLVLAMFNKRGSGIRSKLNWTGIGISSGYLLLCVLLKWAAFSKFENALETQGIEYKEMSTRPAPFTTVLWNANVDTEQDYLIGDYSFFDNKPITFTPFAKDRLLSREFSERPNVKRLIKISEGWYIIDKRDGQWHFNDLRFGLIPKRDGSFSFAFSYLLTEEDGKIMATEDPKTREDAAYLMGQLWERIKGD
ncbi:metal-dependent hydrolase [Aureitalea sp. L0-47]|uniref:metal-dependent hydrolase n=1 Tax=Aureitalea sp. L0-47 TaxID=2816962 RepID=UPI002238D2F8|nr:metal-dependent hydrolase [Aureitalea sp. L0-47]MCW5519428.1 metal-dependent hydrolase [Aureitalea sp. L0-47]